ncbi:hypothetical protein GQ53DRAFT_807096 [Thozetella sp. PMI_491]|nr:hypothetical protein GQ53DRAFT_807096 [Thozetella sp. PMI_491]
MTVRGRTQRTHATENLLSSTRPETVQHKSQKSTNMPNKWTEGEDRELRRLVACFEKETTVNWVEVARRLPGRNNKDCRKRWTKISEQWRKGSWDEEENARLRQAVAQHGTRWIAVAEMVQTRSPDQCQKRWQNALNPELSTAEWTAADDEQLKSAVETYGRNWASISKHFFQNRSPLSLSNRYTSIAAQLESQSDKGQVYPNASVTTPTSVGSDNTSFAYDSDIPTSDVGYGSSFAYDHSPSSLSPSRTSQSYGQFRAYGQDADAVPTTTSASSYGYYPATTTPVGFYNDNTAWPSHGYAINEGESEQFSYDQYGDPGVGGGEGYSNPPPDTAGGGGGGGRGWA